MSSKNLNKYSYHREHSIGFFVNINPKITLRKNLCKSIQDHLMWMDIDDKENESLVKKVLVKGRFMERKTKNCTTCVRPSQEKSRSWQWNATSDNNRIRNPYVTGKCSDSQKSTM